MAYNGWKNYETWNVNLWISNDQGSDEVSRNMAQEAYEDAEADSTFTRDERATLNLTDALRNWIEEQNPLGDGASMFSDLLSAALGEVDWYEIAEHLIADVDKTTDDEPAGEDDIEDAEVES